MATPLAIYGLSAAADLGVTAWAEGRGAVEANPLARDRGARYAISAGVLAGLTAADLRLQRDGRRGTARALRALAVAVRVFVVVRNVKVAR